MTTVPATEVQRGPERDPAAQSLIDFVERTCPPNDTIDLIVDPSVNQKALVRVDAIRLWRDSSQLSGPEDGKPGATLTSWCIELLRVHPLTNDHGAPYSVDNAVAGALCGETVLPDGSVVTEIATLTAYGFRATEYAGEAVKELLVTLRDLEKEGKLAFGQPGES